MEKATEIKSNVNNIVMGKHQTWQPFSWMYISPVDGDKGHYTGLKGCLHLKMLTQMITLNISKMNTKMYLLESCK